MKEVSKYCVKPFEFEGLPMLDELNVYKTYNNALHGRRLIQSYGVIRSELSRLRVDLEADDCEPVAVTSSRQVFRYDHQSASYTLLDFT